MDEAHAAYERLRALLSEREGALIAFSGGVDSTFLLDVAFAVQKTKPVAITVTGLLFPAFEADKAIDFCRERGIVHYLIDVDQLEDERVAANPPERCYLCKRLLFGRLRDEARRLGLPHLMDGTNADDVEDFRPGMKALHELKIFSPLRKAGLSKEMIRELSHERGLPDWQAMSCACYASRFPYGRRIEPADVRRVALVEEKLRAMGFRVYRARHFGELVRIEVGFDEIVILLQPAMLAELHDAAEQAGYRHVEIDPAGYRSGALNEDLPSAAKTEWK
ncbi:MAG TPA: ATP-dependent sacrificial sulfur transferase LarE [bacterium]|nr:ATP-dependent sacrificial sulfur transferase LarE [bacterium]